MRRLSILSAFKKVGNRVFTTREAALISGKSLSGATQSLNNLASEGIIIKIRRGIWAPESETISVYDVVPHLFPKHRAYVSFISALHLHGIIEQIPHVITLASTAHAAAIRTNLGVFQVHHISPLFFAGFGWYRGSGSFLIAEPEKALVDSLYLSAYKRKRFGYFPELYFPETFSFKKAKAWADKIPSQKARTHAVKRLEELFPKVRKENRK
ncbi:MAG: hypothetical protein WC592_05250 [Candidatus Omnitrophota bacterium]